MKETAKVVAFEPDLIFSSRIESTAQKAKYKVRIITDNEELLHQLATDPPDLLLLNLDSLEGNLESLERFVRKGTYKTIGYYSHMNAQLAEEAERIGVNTVSRRAFVARLNDLLR